MFKSFLLLFLELLELFILLILQHRKERRQEDQNSSVEVSNKPALPTVAQKFLVPLDLTDLVSFITFD